MRHNEYTTRKTSHQRISARPDATEGAAHRADHPAPKSFLHIATPRGAVAFDSFFLPDRSSRRLENHTAAAAPVETNVERLAELHATDEVSLCDGLAGGKPVPVDESLID